MLRWLDADTVVGAARAWATAIAQMRKDVMSIGYIGSYARGDWGVGSDLDLVVVLDRTSQPFQERALEFDVLCLPVPVDLLVYTAAELDSLVKEPTRFGQMLQHDLQWLYQRETD